MPSNTALPLWTEHAAGWPVAFAQVREDALLDLALLDWVGSRNLRVAMIASGGCTAAALAASGRLSHLHLIDVNPAQIALTRLKLDLLQSDPPARLRLLGHAEMPADERASALADRFDQLQVDPNVLGPPASVAAEGPDFAGRYEAVFKALRAELAPFAPEIREMLSLSDPPKQNRRAAPTTPLGRALDDAFDRVMALPILVRLFGTEATRNAVQPFSRHFAERTRHALATLPAASNPYLWQLLAGRFPERANYSWLNASAPAALPVTTWTIATMDRALRDIDSPVDLVHLSNILDWLSPEQASETLSLAALALHPGGLVAIRQLNSSLQIPSLADDFEWLADVSADLHRRDRSFFYRAIHVGRKR